MKNKQFIILAVVCVITLLPFLGLTDFHTKGEPREAIVSYTMIETGNWTLPVNNGGDIAYKPPLFHWCIAALSSVMGKVTEYTSRMPSALALIAMVLGGFLFYAKRKGASIALLMGLITLSNFEVHRAGMNCRVDMLLTAFIVLALYQLYRWCEKGRKGFPWIATLLMGCATLTKGPVGILLPCLVTGVFLLLRGTNFFKAFFSMALIAITSCVLPAIWYVAAYQQGGENFINLVMEENFGRFMGKMSYESHENPAYYNVITVVSGYAPYTLLVLLSLFTLTYRKITGKPREWWKRFTAYIREMDDTRLFSLLSIVLIFIFYCIPKSKRSVYLLPIYPFIAYFLAEYIIYLVRRKSKALKLYGGFLSVAAILLLITFIAVRLGLVPDTLFHGKHAAENIAFMNALGNISLNIPRIAIICLPPIAAALFFAVIRKKEPGMKIVYATLFVTFSVFISLDGVYQPTVLNVKSDKGMAEDIQKIVSGKRIYSYVGTDMLRFYTINFYHNDRIGLFEKEMPAEGYLLVGQRDFENFKPKYDPQYLFEETYRSTKRGCDVRDIIYLYHFKRKP
ncbi:glycosyltransferase family 39 protein [uncultured Bacteroides sp.]|uniref:ArnT family glycosyltransferase n=1 Tax=uncultured Bacteroides sp. TaxID=162156 RepID=UPI0026752523|nr:glycosyltransferase family 39 protein [uncultured Bacteroides sp.]